MNKYLLMTCAMLMAVPAYASTDKLIDNVKNKNIDAVETLLAKGENVNTEVLEKICQTLNCNINDIVELSVEKKNEN